MTLEKTIMIKVDPGSSKRKINSVDDSMEELDKTTSRVSRSSDILKKSMIAAAVAAVSLGVKIANVTRKFQTYQASLKTATGSTEKATIAFEALQDFAASTPFALEQSVEAFTKLRNFGLDPSEAALTSFGNTAVALGKDLNQMIEAVADAATGEFERLKEFGIKSKTQGDQVSFTFQGVTTTVGKNAEEITNFLKNIGDVNFAGAMEEQFNSLNGLLSNFGDNVDRLSFNIGQSGLTDVLTDGLNLANQAILDLSDGFESGQIPANIEAIASKFSGMADDIVFSVNAIDNVFNKFFSDIPLDADKSTSLIIDAFASLPENIRAFVKILVVENLAAFDRISKEAEFLKDSFVAIFTDDTIDDALARRAEAINIINDARDDSLSSIIKERDDSVNSFNSQIKKSDELLEAFKRQRDERKKLSEESGGVLGQFKIKTDKSDEPSPVSTASFENTEKFKTEVLRAELRERLEIQRAFNESLLDESATTTEQELAIVEFERQASLASLRRRNEEDEIRFQQELESIKEKGLERQLIIDELEAQRNIRAQLSEIERTQILQEESEKRIEIDRREALGRINTISSFASTALKINEAFGSRSEKSNKKRRKREARVNGAAGIARAWAEHEFYEALGMTIFIAASTEAQVRNIESGGSSSQGGSSGPSAAAIQAPQRQEIPNQRTIDFRGLSEVAAAIRDQDPDEPLPIAFTQRILAGLEQLKELSGE